MLKLSKKMNLSLLALILFITALVSCGGGSGGNNPASSTSKELTAFSFASPASTGIINESAKTVSVTVPYGTDRSALKAVFTTTGVKTTVGVVEQTSGVTVNNFTSSLTYRVTAEDGSYSDYVVTVSVAGSDSRDITSFTITGQSSSSISGTGITVTMPFGSDRTKLTPLITYTGASISPASGVEQDFTDPVIYTVTAADGSKKEYTVTVNMPWVKTIGGTGEDQGYSVCTDSSDNVYTAGSFQGTVNFGGGTITSDNDSADGFIAKYDKNGNYIWAKTFGSGSSGSGVLFFSVCTDSSDNVYAAGVFNIAINFGSGDVSPEGIVDIFIVKYDKNGNYIWVKTFGSGSGGFSNLSSLSTDSSDNVYIAGVFNYTINFGGGDVSPNGGHDAFVAKYDKDGNYIWAKKIGGSNEDTGTSVCTDSSDNVYVAGYFYGTVNFGDGDETAPGLFHAFIVKYDKLGNYIWAKNIGEDYAYGFSVCTDSKDNIYLTGSFRVLADFGGGDVTSNGSSDFFIAKYDKDGNYRWSETFGGTDGDIGYSVCTDSLDNAYVTGMFSGSVDFGDGSVTSNGFYDIFITKFDENGTYIWSKTYGGTSGGLYDKGNSVSADSKGNVYAAGLYNSTVNFGDGNVTSAGNTDIFLLKITD